MEWVLFWVACGISAGVVANAKGRSGWGWFFLGTLLLGPLAVLTVGFMPGMVPAPPRVDPGTRSCPHCHETIFSTARMCRFCGKTLVPGLE